MNIGNYYDEDKHASNSGDFDEKPLGGAKSGGYNLDNLEDINAFGMTSGSSTRKPPVKVQKKKEEIKQEEDVVMSDETNIVKQEQKKVKQQPEQKPKP